MKLKKGDKVKVIAGKDKGKEGKVERVYSKQNKAMILGINQYKKHVKKNEQMPKGGVVEVPRPIEISKISFICPKCGKKAKVGYKVEKNKKIRICRNCKSKI